MWVSIGIGYGVLAQVPKGFIGALENAQELFLYLHFWGLQAFLMRLEMSNLGK